LHANTLYLFAVLQLAQADTEMQWFRASACSLAEIRDRHLLHVSAFGSLLLLPRGQTACCCGCDVTTRGPRRPVFGGGGAPPFLTGGGGADQFSIGAAARKFCRRRRRQWQFR